MLEDCLERQTQVAIETQGRVLGQRFHHGERPFTRLMESVARFGAEHGLDLVPTSRYVWEPA